MKIDAHIFALVQTLAAFLQFTALFDQYWGAKNRKGIGWWMMGNASLTLGYLCNYLRDMSSFGLLLIVISNVLFVLGMELIYVGVMRFFDRQERRGWLIGFCIIISLIAAYFTYINNDLGFRRINISIAVATMSFFIVRAIFLYKTDSVRSSAYFLICVFIVNGCFFSVRAFTPFLGTIGEMFTLSLMQISTYLTTLLTTSLWTIGFILMDNQRLNTERSNKNQRPAIRDHVMAVVIYLLLALITQSLFKTITVWPSAGLVLAAFMVLGVHIWPSIAIGTFLGVIAYFIEIDQPPFCAANLVINLTTVIGNTSAGVVAFRVCGRVDSLVNSFGKYKWIINRFLVSVFIFGIVSAIPGV
ncbi:MAG: hypothetical protein HQK62_14850, partial [Desulfamplus sp.]|nr:hypothetical protein [Desulfamplus sp.]